MSWVWYPLDPALSFSRAAAGLVLALVVMSQPVRAADEAATDGANSAPKTTFTEQFEEVWERDKLTGDWQGWRKDLLEHGIDAQFRLSQYGQSVASGGRDKNTEYGGTMDYRVNADLRKFFGMWEGLSINMHARTRFGHDVQADAGEFTLPNAGLLMPLPGGYDGTDVTGLIASQTFPFLGGRVGNVTLGKIDVIDTVTLFFPSIEYGQAGFSNANGLITALPWFGAVRGLSLYGGYAVTFNQEYQLAESGFLLTGTEGVSTSWNEIDESFDEGVWMAGFQRIFWKLDEKPGNLLIFAAGSTRDQPSNDSRDVTFVPGQGLDDKEKKPWDIAAYLYQVLWQAEDDPNRKATMYIGGTVGPDNPQFAQYHLFANVEAFGPMRSRPDDRMGVAFWYNWLSDDYKDLVDPVADLRDLYGFEVYYNIAVNKWLHVTPALQVIRNEWEGDNVAVVPGVRGVIDF